MQKNLAAYTSTDQTYPDFILINRQQDGSVEIMIREKATQRGNGAWQGDMACIKLSGEGFAKFIGELIKSGIDISLSF